MNPILHQLYSGDLTPQEKIWPSPSEQLPHKQWQTELSSFLQTQNPELAKTFRAMMDEFQLIYKTDTEEMFYQGFGLAVKLFTEALAY